MFCLGVAGVFVKIKVSGTWKALGTAKTTAEGTEALPPFSQAYQVRFTLCATMRAMHGLMFCFLNRFLLRFYLCACMQSGKLVNEDDDYSIDTMERLEEMEQVTNSPHKTPYKTSARRACFCNIVLLCICVWGCQAFEAALQREGRLRAGAGTAMPAPLREKIKTAIWPDLGSSRSAIAHSSPHHIHPGCP